MAFCFFAARFSFRVRIELALVGAERSRPGAPTCGSGGPARPARRRHSHSRGHTVCISKISTEPGGPENPRMLLEGPARCPRYYSRASTRVFWRSHQDSAAAGWGGPQNPPRRSLALGPARSRFAPSSNRGKFRPEQLLGLRRPWKYISGTRRRHRRLHRNPCSTQLPSSGLGLSRPNPSGGRVSRRAK